MLKEISLISQGRPLNSEGAFVGSLFVGLADNFGKVFLPELSLFIIFGCVTIVLAFKPTGLLGKPH
jgi:branched-chain amino acid transport system permease protein